MTAEEKKLYQQEWRSKNQNYNAEYLKKWRHTKGISKGYRGEAGSIGGISGIITNKRLHKKIERARRYGSELKISILQIVYEDNIKKYGRLTCYLCNKHISFGDDSLDHKIPAVKGGTNDYENLAISHLSCNRKKSIKTEFEYREIIK